MGAGSSRRLRGVPKTLYVCSALVRKSLDLKPAPTACRLSLYRLPAVNSHCHDRTLAQRGVARPPKGFRKAVALTDTSSPTLATPPVPLP